MKIRLNEEFEVDSPENGSVCWILKYYPLVKTERSGAKIGQRRKSGIVTYHAGIKQALNKAVDLGLSNVSSVEEILSRLDGIETTIRNLKIEA